LYKILIFIEALEDKANFFPVYEYLSCPEFKEDNEDCLGGGRYCGYDPDEEG